MAIITINGIVTAFETNVRGVHRLVNFDRDVLGFVITQLEQLNRELVQHGMKTPQLTGKNTIQLIKNIRDNNSLRTRYDIIFNQAVVLLVSYFASALADLFRAGVSARISADEHGPLLDEEVRLTFKDIRDRDWNLKDAIPDLLIAKRDLTFQDMGSTHRAFSTYLDIEMEKDEVVNNIILAQGCRHVIVHAGGIVSERLIRQVSSAVPRHLKPDLKPGQNVQFSSEEVTQVTDNMRRYIDHLANRLRRVV